MKKGKFIVSLLTAATLLMTSVFAVSAADTEEFYSGFPIVQEQVPVSTDHVIPSADPNFVEMTLDEFETVRLMDRLGFDQEDCAAQMNVSRTTVQAIYDSARKKLALALVEGRRLQILGGAYVVCPSSEECCGKECCRREHSESCGGKGCFCCPGCRDRERSIEKE